MHGRAPLESDRSDHPPADPADKNADRINPEFNRLWIAQTVSGFGARVTREALPLAAVLTLGARPAQLGLLAAVANAPQIFMGLTAGGFVDRTPRRLILIGADLFRGALLVTVPLAAWFHVLTLIQLYVVALGIGSASVLSDLAAHAFLPSLLGEKHLAKGNTRLSVADSLAEIAGPALTGFLVQLLTAPLAIGVDVVTYIFSAGLLTTIGKKVAMPDAGERQTWRRNFKDGLSTIMGDPLVRPVFMMDMFASLFGTMAGAVYLFFIAKQLHLSPFMIGLTFAAGGVGALLGAMVRAPVVERLGLGRAVLVTAFVGGGLGFVTPFISGAPLFCTALLCGLRLVGASLGVLTGVSLNTLRQLVIPGRMLGRVGAVFQVGVGAAAMLGGLIGGGLGDVIGTRQTLFIAALGGAATGLWAVFSKLRSLETMPAADKSQRNM
ncbi:MAG: MFS transporter [Caulobacteraceae bacterium]